MKAFIRCKDGPYEVEMVDIFNVGGYTFFIHCDIDYIPTEWETGLAMPTREKKDGKITYISRETIEQAKDIVKKRYEKEGPTRFDTVIAMGKINHGVVNSGKPPTRKQVLESVSKEVEGE